MIVVATHYRYKRPPRKKPPVALEVPAIVTRKQAGAPAVAPEPAKPVPPVSAAKPAIVTSISRKRTRFLALPAADDDTGEAMTARARAVIARRLKPKH